MTSTQIEYFLSAAKHLNFTRVADEYYTTQPTVSRQIAMLEEEIGLALFERSGKKLLLTPEGQLLKTEWARFPQMLESTLYRARQLEFGLSGNLNIGCLTTLNTDIYVEPPLTAFAKANPNVDISIEYGSFSVLRERLESGACDIVFTLGFDLAAYENVESLVCYRAQPMLIMSREHPLAKQENCKLSDFAEETFLLPDISECFGRGNVLREILSACGIPDARIGYVRNQESILLNVRAGRGVSILTSCHWSMFDAKFKYLPLLDEPLLPKPSLVAIWKKENKNQVMPHFLKLLATCEEIDVFQN